MRFHLKTTTKAAHGADTMTQGVRVIVAKPDYPGLNPRFHRMETCKFSCDLQPSGACHVSHVHTQKYTAQKDKNVIQLKVKKKGHKAGDGSAGLSRAALKQTKCRYARNTLLKIKLNKPSHVFSPSAGRKKKADLTSKPARSTKSVPGEPGLHGETLALQNKQRGK